MAEIVWCRYIFHLAWPMSLHYLVKGWCSKLLPSTGFVRVRLLRFGVKVKRAYCRDNFLAQRPPPDMRRLSGDDFFMFQQDGSSVHQHATPSLSWSERKCSFFLDTVYIISVVYSVLTLDRTATILWSWNSRTFLKYSITIIYTSTYSKWCTNFQISDYNNKVYHWHTGLILHKRQPICPVGYDGTAICA